MNTELLLSVIRQTREYRELLASYTSKYRASTRRKPTLASGLSECALRIFTAALAGDISRGGQNVLLLYGDEKEARESAEFLSGAGVSARHYPSRDFNYSNITASHEYENERLSLLFSLDAEEEPQVVCAGISAALQATMNPETMRKMTVRLSHESTIDLSGLTEALGNSGYTRVDMVEGPGQYTVRGGIIDVYSSDGTAYRVELFGDEIDRMGTFDPESQRFTDYCDGDIVIPPARELAVSDVNREEIGALIKKQLAQLGRVGDVTLTERARRLLTEELDAVENSAELNFADKYLPLIHPNGRSLIELFDGFIMMNSPSSLVSRAEAARALLEQSLAEMCESYELPAEIADTYKYMRGIDCLGDKLSRVNSIVTDSVTRSFDFFTVGEEFDFRTRHITAYGERKELLYEDIGEYVSRGWNVLAVCSAEPERGALTERLVEAGISSASADSLEKFPFPSKSSGSRGAVYTATDAIEGGFELQTGRVAVLDCSSGKSIRRSAKVFKNKKARKNSEAIMSYADLEVGDLVVHAAYGIGMYMGLENLNVGGVSRDYVSIKYAGTDKLFLPVDQLDLVSKYIGAGSDSGAVKLSKMGGAEWSRAKSRAKAATREMAKELIQLYAARRRSKGIAFEPDDDMCREFAATFEYEETDGQLQAIEDVRRDMEAEYPMDRLICGDVGYGKTEVAMRAAFKAVMSGKQVAVLVPTTILAYQHYKNFKSRMRQFPTNVSMLSRFVPESEQRAALRKLKRGETDIIIGTHRLISSDVEFHDLGLVIIDEEQRFGVAQKEKLKKIATGADVLTLTATPIPRTLNMAMGGIVDMSLLEEAPGDRVPVQTYVLEHDDGIILEAIRRELRRDGQVFYLYNRVEGIYNVAGRISKEIPDARIAVAHGKMDRDELEDIWEALINGDVDILVCTTIIETGVDVPNANTLIIENADMYGLSQLHQIRGRVGRSGRRAYAYLTYRKNKVLSEVAEKRLEAIKEYAQFGAGFRIALRDLEIRGAGNLLGAEQHGHMDSVGYDLYMKLLNEAVIEEKGETEPKKTECAVNIQADAYLSKSYIPFPPQRIELYKKIARIDCEADYEDILDEICDRFGEPGAAAVNLCRIALIKAYASHAGITNVDEQDGALRLIPEKLDPSSVSALASSFPDAKIRVSLGRQTAITAVIPKGQRNTEFLLSLLGKYLALSENTADKGEPK